MDLKIIVIVGKGSNTQKYWKKKHFFRRDFSEKIFLKSSGQFNGSGQTRGS